MKVEELLARYLKLRKVIRKDTFFRAHLLGYDKVVKLASKHHKNALDMMHSNRFYCIQIPRGCYKTTVFTILDTIGDVIADPNTRQLICHFAGANARAMLDEIQNHFIANDDLRFLFPEIVPSNTKRPETGDWSADSIRVKRTKQYKESTIHALGADQTMASYHFDKIRFDDLVVEQSTTTTDQVEKADNFFKKSYSLLNNHDPTSKIGIIGTQWTPDDTMVKIENKKILAPDGYPFTLFKVPDVHLDSVGNRVSNFPEILPIPVLDGLLKSQGNIIYSAFYKLDAIEIVDGLWKKSDIAYYDEIPHDRKFRIVGSLDPSISEKDNKTNSDTALVIIALDDKNELWVFEYDLSKGVAKFEDKIFELYLKWKNMTRVVRKSTGIVVNELVGEFRFFVLEVKLFQKLLEKQLRVEMQKRNIWIPIRTDDPFMDKIKRIMILDPLMSNKAFHIKPGMVELESQIIRFGRPNTKLDILDAIAQAYKAMNLVSMRKKPKKQKDEYEEMWQEARVLGA